MLINFITDITDKILLSEIDKLFEAFALKYQSGNFEKNIVHYLEYKCKPANINIFYGYINNLLVDYSKNNIFVFDKIHFIQAWTPQLHNYDMICVKNEDDKIIESFIKYEIVNLNMNSTNINTFYKSVMGLCKKIKTIRLPELTNHLKPEDLPHISICMPTFNRKKFMKLVELNYNNTNYPKDKIEFIIVDDGTDPVKDDIPKGDNIKYYFYKKKGTIGWKRNECVRLATNNIIAFMDDDDFYYPNSLLNRVGNLLKSGKDCVFCSTIGSFHIKKLSSIINPSPIEYPLEKKVSEATLTFKKSFWHNNKFNNEDTINEGEAFVKNALNKCKEINWEDVIVQLLHTYNTCNKKLDIEDGNGSHFGFTDTEFELITSI